MSEAPLPAALAALVRARSIGRESFDADGRLDLKVGNLPRIRVWRGRRDGSVVVESRLTPLPSSAREREGLLARMMLRVTAGADRQVGTLALSADADQLLLQAEVDATGAGSFEAAFQAYLNEMDYWKAVIGRRRV
jgi:Tir chaperone protein (CesT) family